MAILYVLVGIAVVAVVALLTLGRLDGLTETDPERAPLLLPAEGPVTAADLDGVRFAVGFRGYRMDEVDAVLDRVGAELADRDARIAELEGRTHAAPASPPALVEETAAPDEGLDG